jgi:hypothetical protein
MDEWAAVLSFEINNRACATSWLRQFSESNEISAAQASRLVHKEFFGSKLL